MEKDEKAGFKPSNHHKYRVFRFVVIIPYGHTSATIKSIYSADLETVRADTGQTRAVLERVYMHESEAQRRALAERMDAIINNKPVLNKEDKSLLNVVAKLLEQNDVGAALQMILDAKGANVSLGAV